MCLHVDVDGLMINDFLGLRLTISCLAAVHQLQFAGHSSFGARSATDAASRLAATARRALTALISSVGGGAAPRSVEAGVVATTMVAMRLGRTWGGSPAMGADEWSGDGSKQRRGRLDDSAHSVSSDSGRHHPSIIQWANA